MKLFQIDMELRRGPVQGNYPMYKTFHLGEDMLEFFTWTREHYMHQRPIATIQPSFHLDGWPETVVDCVPLMNLSNRLGPKLRKTT